MDIETRAVVTTVAKVEVVGNHIESFHTTGFIFSNWNRIIFDDNIIMHLYPNFIEVPLNPDIEMFSFRGNELYMIDQSALSYVSELDYKILIFDDNFFNKSCECSVYDWLEKIANSSQKAKILMNTSYCSVDNFLSLCYSIPIGIINMLNFTEKACSNLTVCKTYNAEILNETNIFLQTDEFERENRLTIMFIVGGILVIIIVAISVVLLIKRGKWLKRKTYFRNMQYNTQLKRSEEENTINTEDENEKLQIPEELTIEFLQVLSKRLDDPKTHQEASEMIERLYEMFIIEDNYENNNRQNEEPHLYEELGNLNLEIPPPPYEDDKCFQTNEPRNILKLMEEKFNKKYSDNEETKINPALAGDYSEPTDAEIHLYSELRYKIGKNNEPGNASVTTGSSKDVETLLETEDKSIFEAGPSFTK